MSATTADKCKEQQVKSVASQTYKYALLHNVHLQLQPPPNGGPTCLTRGDVSYFHYSCDGHNDVGWGCAYRTLQTMCALILGQCKHTKQTHSTVPSIREIQETLVRIGDKPECFVGSREWIGALELSYVVDTLYDVPCKILHIPCQQGLNSHLPALKQYFEDFGGFVMMGGDVDAASKGIAGVHMSGSSEAYLLVVDPHFVGIPKSAQELIERGYIRWQHSTEFVDSSFYNLCLPQLKA